MGILSQLLAPFLGYLWVTSLAAIPGLALSAFVPCIGADLGFFQMVVIAPLVGLIWIVSADQMGGVRFLAALVAIGVYQHTLFNSVDSIPTSGICCKQLIFPLDGKDCTYEDCYDEETGRWTQCVRRPPASPPVYEENDSWGAPSETWSEDDYYDEPRHRRRERDRPRRRYMPPDREEEYDSNWRYEGI